MDGWTKGWRDGRRGRGTARERGEAMIKEEGGRTVVCGWGGGMERWGGGEESGGGWGGGREGGKV